MAILEMRDITPWTSAASSRSPEFSPLGVQQGELRCLIGPNGAGKTTALDVICGKTRPPASGHVVFDSHDITRMEEPIASRGSGWGGSSRCRPCSAN